MKFRDQEEADTKTKDLANMFDRIFGEIVPAYEATIKSKKIEQNQHRSLLSGMAKLYFSLENTLYGSVIKSFLSTFENNVATGVIKLTKSAKLMTDDFCLKWEQIIDKEKTKTIDYLSFRAEANALQEIHKSKTFSNILDKLEEFVGLSKKEDMLNDFRVFINSQLRKTGNSDLIIENQKMDKVEPLEFEYLVARIFNLMGYETKVTPGSGDYGIDIIAKNNKETIAIQCKKYNESIKISNREIQMFLGAIQLKGHLIDRGVFVTTADYTDQALRQADGNNIELWNGHKLRKIMNKYLLEGAIE